MKRCNICLALKTVQHKLYGDLQSLLVLTHCWKDLSIDFVTSLPNLINWKGDSYDSILVIVDRLIKMVHYKPVKVSINTPDLAKIIIDIVVRYYGSQTLLSLTGSRFSPQSFGYPYAISLASSGDSPLPSTYRQTVKLKGKIVQWKPIFEPLSTLSRMIEHGFFPWQSLPTIIPRMPASAIYFSSSIADIILGFLTKKT